MSHTLKLLLFTCCVALLCSCSSVSKIRQQSKSSVDSTAESYHKEQVTAVQTSEIYQQKDSTADVTKTTETANDFSVEFIDDSSAVGSTDPVIIEKTDGSYIVRPGGRKIKGVAIKEKSTAKNKQAVAVSETIAQQSQSKDSSSKEGGTKVKLHKESEDELAITERQRMAFGIVILLIVLIGGGYLMYRHNQKLRINKRMIDEGN